MKTRISGRAYLPSSSAFTVVEVLIAASILSVFLIGLFQIYRSGSRSFMLGTWKTKAQKDAQLFLEEFRTVVEKSGNGTIARDTAIDTVSQPLFFNSLASGTPYDIKGIALGSDVSMGFLSIFTPCTLYSNLALAKKVGTWLGCHLLARRGTLSFSMILNPAVLPPAIQLKAPALGGDFVSAGAAALSSDRTLKDVESFRFTVIPRGDSVQLFIAVTLARPGEGATISETRVEQSIRVNLLKGVAVNAL